MKSVAAWRYAGIQDAAISPEVSHRRTDAIKSLGSGSGALARPRNSDWVRYVRHTRRGGRSGAHV